MNSSHEDLEIRHEPDRSRFVADVGGGEAFAEYERKDGAMVLTRTEVPSEAEGAGVGSALARAALGHAREEGLRVVPRCPFMTSYIERHPEYQDLVDHR